MTPIAKLTIALIAGLIIAALLLEGCEDAAEAPATQPGVSVDIDSDRSKKRDKTRSTTPKKGSRR